jgi:hypothetical protein
MFEDIPVNLTRLLARERAWAKAKLVVSVDGVEFTGVVRFSEENAVIEVNIVTE